MRASLPLLDEAAFHASCNAIWMMKVWKMHQKIYIHQAVLTTLAERDADGAESRRSVRAS
eukprot:5183266-Pleurochrysis_carterae.AAC.1